jgi:hypothetical protein
LVIKKIVSLQTKTNQFIQMKRIIIFLTILLSFNRLATSQNLLTADSKPIHFGFTLGINAMDYGVSHSLAAIDGTVYQADVSKFVPGFSVGVIGDLRLGEYFNLRLIPALHLSQRTLSYVNSNNDLVKQLDIKSNVLTVPLYVKYSSVRVKNYRPYLIAGGGLAFDLGRERESPVLLKQMDYFIDFGVGCTFYFQYFRFSPEIKFAMGFNNLLTPLSERPKDFISNDDRKYTDALSKLTSRLFTFVFNFE